MEHPIKMDDLVVPLFSEIPISVSFRAEVATVQAKVCLEARRIGW